MGVVGCDPLLAFAYCITNAPELQVPLHQNKLPTLFLALQSFYCIPTTAIFDLQLQTSPGTSKRFTQPDLLK
jgi:hypothetical protein